MKRKRKNKWEEICGRKELYYRSGEKLAGEVFKAFRI